MIFVPDATMLEGGSFKDIVATQQPRYVILEDRQQIHFAAIGGILEQIFNCPSCLISAVHKSLNEEGEMTDEFMTVLLGKVMKDLARWAT